ncbi:MAG: hypothetical protein AB7O44_20655 [Hyphomicrobiaceae bacterium]
MSSPVEVVPFFKRSVEGSVDWPGESYVAGFRKPDGTRLGVEVVLPANIVEHAVLGESRLSLSMSPDGTFILHGEFLSDDTLDAASGCGLRKQSLQTLLEECLQSDLVAMEENPIGDLVQLRRQLASALSRVDDALDQLKSRR